MEASCRVHVMPWRHGASTRQHAACAICRACRSIAAWCISLCSTWHAQPWPCDTCVMAPSRMCRACHCNMAPAWCIVSSRHHVARWRARQHVHTRCEGHGSCCMAHAGHAMAAWRASRHGGTLHGSCAGLAPCKAAWCMRHAGHGGMANRGMPRARQPSTQISPPSAVNLGGWPPTHTKQSSSMVHTY